MESVIGLDKRARHVRAASSIGLVVALLFSVYNLLTPGLLVLGVIELAAALVLLTPAVVMSHTPSRVGASETLLLLSAGLIFGALIVTGGIAGTGLFWVYTVPFLAFFLKGQRLGWMYSLAFLGLAAAYLLGLRPVLPTAYPFSALVSAHFLLSLSFYTLVAAAFNHVRSQYEAQLKQRKDEAEAASLVKSRFLAAASHDLRQPAHALGMFVARLTQLPHDTPTRALVDGVDASVRALQEMLDAFFDYSRLDAPSMQVHTQAFPVNHLFEQLRINFEGVAASKGLRLRIRPSGVWLQTDPVLLHRVLLNLVGNALQHTRTGVVLVVCRPVFGATQARIEVWDSGVGIAPEFHQKIFEEFFQVGNPERDRSKGLGLGLSIVARSCRLLNLPLRMRSEVGCGSRFCVQVPTTPAQTMAECAAVAEISGGATFDQLHVLLIEDDALGGMALKGLLESWGCQVTVADTALAALALLRHAPAPDLVVSDFRLRGEINGIEAVRMVREVIGLDVAACLISGDTAQQVREQVQAAGLVLLQKPVRPAKLRSVLRHAVQSKTADSDALDAV
jgi:signal transduction histidine kinase/ActR/RegA family two-component response regulator